MRLSNNEIKSIVITAKKFFGESASVILFGSRADDKIKGGDIDILVFPQNIDIGKSLLKAKIDFLVDLKNTIGDQKIDVIIGKPEDKRSIVITAKLKGIKLC